MARKKTDTAEFFPHFAKGGKTIFMLESKYGNDGYSFWFKSLEVLSTSEGHYFDLSIEDNFDFLIAKTKVLPEVAEKIILDLCKWKNFDKELWETKKIVWCQDLVDNLKDLYTKRKREIPLRPYFCHENTSSTIITHPEIPHSIVENSIVKESIEEESKVEDSILLDSKTESLPDPEILEVNPQKEEKPKEGKEKDSAEKEKTIYQQFIEVYHQFILRKTEVPAKIDGTEGNAAKAIIAYIKTASKDKTDEGYIKYWKHLLNNWEKLDNFYQGKMKLVEINSNMINLINQIKNGTKANIPHKPLSSSIRVTQNTSFGKL